MQANQICLLASRIAKGGAGMVALAGQCLNLVLEDLKLNRDLKVNRVTQPLIVGPGTYGPFALESDYLRTYDLFYTLPGSQGLPQRLTPVTMEQFDAELKTAATSNYPYEFATDLSTQAQTPIPTNPSVITDIEVSAASGGYLAAPVVNFLTLTGSGAAAQGRLTAIGAKSLVGGGEISEGQIVTVLGGVFDRPAILEKMFGGLVYGIVDGGSYSVIPGLANVVPGNFTQTGSSSSISVADANGNVTTLHPLIIWGLGKPVLTAGGQGYAVGDAAFPTGGVSLVPPNIDGQYTTTVAPATGGSAGNLYIYPQGTGQLTLTHRYMVNQPDLITPESSTQVPWFPFTKYLIEATAAMMMGITGDDRKDSFDKRCEEMLRPFLIMEGDEQQTVRAVRLDPRHFRAPRSVRPTKTNPF